MGAYRPARMDVAHWGREVDRNLFATRQPTAGSSPTKDATPIRWWAIRSSSIRRRAIIRVKRGSPALGLGFVNFAMDQFGVQLRRG